MKIAKADINNVVKVLEKSQLSIFNSEVIKKFEEKLNLFLSKKKLVKTVVLPNCTTAIFISLQLLNLEKNNEFDGEIPF